jgi:putative PEP-CTERM system integral membrane protein
MQKKKRFSVVAPAIFWGYNGIYFICLLLVGMLLIGNGGFFFTRFMVSIPLNVAMMLYLLLLTPIACSVLAFKIRKFRLEPAALMKLFFGVELPIIGLAFLRLLFIREMTPALWLFFISVILSTAGLLVSLLYPHLKTKLQHSLHFISQEIAVLLSGYVALLTLFFLPVIAAMILKGLFSIDYWRLAELFVRTSGLLFVSMISWIILFSLTVGFFFIVPIVSIVIYFGSFVSLKKELQNKYGPVYRRIVMYGFGFAYVLSIVLFSLQSGTDSYIQQLQTIRSATTFEAKQAQAAILLKDEDNLRRTFTDAYLSPYRYVGDADISMVKRGYIDQLGFDENTSTALQNLFNSLASPFVYHGRFKQDVDRAAKDYEEIFDANIQEGEQGTILAALNGTNTTDELKAGLLDKNNRKVLITEQKVTASTYEDDLIARVQFEETYKNMANESQEVYYEFSLPEDAVLTDLKLGPNLEYQAVIAPKGAARTTYEAQVQRRVDPALLEQTGPRQYRLRVFPVPAPLDFLERQRLTSLNHGQAPEEKAQRVLMEYVTFRTKEGIPLPTFTETRNAYADGSTLRKYILNEKDVSIKDSASTIPLMAGAPACPDKILSAALPSSVSQDKGSLYFLPHSRNPALQNYTCDGEFDIGKVNGSTFALLLDVSYSNKFHDWDGYLKNTMNIEKLLANNNTVDLYYFNDRVSQRISLTKKVLDQGIDVTHFGKTDRLNAIMEAEAQREFGGYAAVFMITDGSDFEQAGEIDPKINTYGTPIYIIHPDGKMPQYSDELTNSVIKSGGGVFADPSDAFRHFWLRNALAVLKSGLGGLKLLDVNEYGAWIMKTDTAASKNPLANNTVADSDLTPDDSAKVWKLLNEAPKNQLREFELLAAKKLAEAMIMDLDQMEVLGQDGLGKIHQLAMDNFIVTPYSSMIALVDDWQREQLKIAEAGNDPFSTKYDVGQEKLGAPAGTSMLNIGAVPEPHEWAMIFIGLFLIAYFYRKPIWEFARIHVRLPR